MLICVSAVLFFKQLQNQSQQGPVSVFLMPPQIWVPGGLTAVLVLTPLQMWIHFSWKLYGHPTPTFQLREAFAFW